MPDRGMRGAATFLVVSVAVVASLANAAAAQGLEPEEQDMELRGTPPITPPPLNTDSVDSGDAAQSPSPTDLGADTELMDRLLEISTQKTSREQRFSAAAGIMGGAILLGIGAWRLVEQEPQSQFTRGLGVMFMTLGAADLTTGIFAATRIPHERQRLERWNDAKADGITEVELARAEGELQAAADTRHGERMLVRWNGLTHAIAGALVLGFSPIPDNSRTDRISAWIIGSVFVATGMTTFGFSFRPTPSERAWKAYQEKQDPSEKKRVTLRAMPTVSRRAFGVGMAGRF